MVSRFCVSALLALGVTTAAVPWAGAMPVGQVDAARTSAALFVAMKKKCPAGQYFSSRFGCVHKGTYGGRMHRQ